MAQGRAPASGGMCHPTIAEVDSDPSGRGETLRPHREPPQKSGVPKARPDAPSRIASCVLLPLARRRRSAPSWAAGVEAVALPELDEPQRGPGRRSNPERQAGSHLHLGRRRPAPCCRSGCAAPDPVVPTLRYEQVHSHLVAYEIPGSRRCYDPSTWEPVTLLRRGP